MAIDAVNATDRYCRWSHLDMHRIVVIKLIRLSRDRNQKTQQIQQMNSHLAILKQLRDLQHVVSMYDRVLQFPSVAMLAVATLRKSSHLIIHSLLGLRK